jgi:hypothetical protein
MESQPKPYIPAAWIDNDRPPRPRKSQKAPKIHQRRIGKHAYRFHPAFRECRTCKRLWRADTYRWHAQGWQYTTCRECTYALEKKWQRQPPAAYIRRPWTPDERTILYLGHHQLWHPAKIAAHTGRNVRAVKAAAFEAGLGPWPCYRPRSRTTWSKADAGSTQ